MKRGLIIMGMFLFLFSYLVYAENTTTINGSDISKKISDISRQNIELSQEVQDFAKFFFKSQDNLSFSEFVILSVIWILIFILIAFILPFIPFFENATARYVGAFTITCLVSISGGIYYGSSFLLGLSNIFNFFENKPARTFFSLLISSLIVLALVYGLRRLKSSMQKEKAESEGMKAGLGAKLLKIFGEHGR